MTHWILRGVRPLGGNTVDIRLRDGVIADMGHDLPLDQAEVLDAAGLIALPGRKVITASRAMPRQAPACPPLAPVGPVQRDSDRRHDDKRQPQRDEQRVAI